MQSLIRVSCAILTIDQDYHDKYTLPLVIEALRGQTKIFQIFFRTRGALIDTIVAQIFEDDDAATPPPSPSPPRRLDPITLDPTKIDLRYITIFRKILMKKKNNFIIHYINIL